MQVFDAMHLRALAGLPQLMVLNLYFLHWAESVTSTGLTLLADKLPRLRVLNAPEHVLVRPHCWITCSWASHSGKSCTLLSIIYMRSLLHWPAAQCACVFGCQEPVAACKCSHQAYLLQRDSEAKL